jgi:hypothetical protein
MEPFKFVLHPAVSPTTRVEVADDRESQHPDVDYVEVSLWMKDVSSGASVSLSLDEIRRLRDALTTIIERELPQSHY